MANENFKRKYIMKCGKMNSRGFQIGNVENVDDVTLHVCFSIEKSNAESPNDAKVQIWNLSDNNLKILESNDCIVELRAGYNENLPLLLVGNITSVTTTKENADRLTELTVVDGRVALRDTTVSISLNGKVNAKEVYTTVANAMGMSIVFANDLSFITLPNGFSYVGKAKNAMQKIANCCGHNWTIQNQVLQVTLPGRPINTKGYLLSSDTGLIGIPKRIVISSGEQEQIGWEVEYFLNGAIGVNDVVQLKSSVANGYFLVHKVTIDGDNMEGDWVCSAQVLEIKAQPVLDVKAEKIKEAELGSNAGNINKGDKVKVIRTYKSGSKTVGYQYSGGTFICWYDIYDVISISGERVVIGIGSTVTAAVNVKDLEKV